MLEEAYAHAWLQGQLDYDYDYVDSWEDYKNEHLTEFAQEENLTQEEISAKSAREDK